MQYLVALYGSQHHELIRNGKDGSSGRLNGNFRTTDASSRHFRLNAWR
jgi:hypothetical protein